MKNFEFTLATVTALLVHQAVAADTMIDIQWEDYSHFKLEETSSDVISKCAVLPERGIYALSVNIPYTCYLFMSENCDGEDYLQFRGKPRGSKRYGMLKGKNLRAVRCDKST